MLNCPPFPSLIVVTNLNEVLVANFANNAFGGLQMTSQYICIYYVYTYIVPQYFKQQYLNPFFFPLCLQINPVTPPLRLAHLFHPTRYPYSFLPSFHLSHFFFFSLLYFFTSLLFFLQLSSGGQSPSAAVQFELGTLLRPIHRVQHMKPMPTEKPHSFSPPFLLLLLFFPFFFRL